jgi:hypothetical protein
MKFSSYLTVNIQISRYKNQRTDLVYLIQYLCQPESFGVYLYGYLNTTG